MADRKLWKPDPERRRRAAEMKDWGASLTVSDEAEQRQKEFQTLKDKISAPLDMTQKPSTIMKTLQEHVNEFVWFLLENAPYLRARNREGYADFIQLYQTWAEIVRSDLMQATDVVSERENLVVPDDMPEERRKIIKDRAMQMAKNYVIDAIYYVNTHLFPISARLWAIGWGEEDVTAKTIYQIQVPIMMGRQPNQIDPNKITQDWKET